MTEREKARSSGLLPEKQMTTALDPFTRILYGIEGYKHEGLWTIVSRRDAKIAVVKPTRQASATVSPAMLRVQRAALMLHPPRPPSDPGPAIWQLPLYMQAKRRALHRTSHLRTLRSSTLLKRWSR